MFYRPLLIWGQKRRYCVPVIATLSRVQCGFNWSRTPGSSGGLSRQHTTRTRLQPESFSVKVVHKYKCTVALLRKVTERQCVAMCCTCLFRFHIRNFEPDISHCTDESCAALFLSFEPTKLQAPSFNKLNFAHPERQKRCLQCVRSVQRSDAASARHETAPGERLCPISVVRVSVDVVVIASLFISLIQYVCSTEQLDGKPVS